MTDTVADLATHLQQPPETVEPWERQSLAQGAAGIALLHLERATAGHAPWTTAHRWIRCATAAHVNAADTTGLFLGATAVAFVLSTTPKASPIYADARYLLHRHATALAHRRVDAALARIDSGARPDFGEYDIFYGLAGIGAYLLRTHPHGSALGRILSYLVALTHPAANGEHLVPGWWVHHGPDRSPSSGGHGNLGAAHGITGPLMLLAHAARRGLLVDGQTDAIRRVCVHLDLWRQDGPTGPWWPEHVTLAELASGRTRQPGPGRPSWCYGTPGTARAGQLAAIALDDPQLQRFYEDALYQCLTDPDQLAHIDTVGLCHGWAGVYQTTYRAARDALDPRLSGLLPPLGRHLADAAKPGSGKGLGLLEGDAGACLALTTLDHHQTPTTGWDACLLID